MEDGLKKITELDFEFTLSYCNGLYLLDIYEKGNEYTPSNSWLGDDLSLLVSKALRFCGDFHRNRGKQSELV